MTGLARTDTPPREGGEFAFRTTTLLTTLGATSLIAAAGIGTGLVAARSLGPEGRGELAALTLWAATILYSTTFGIAEATGYCTAKARPDQRPTILATSQVLAVGYGVVAIVCAWLLKLVFVSRWPAGLAAMLIPYVGLYAIPGAAALSLVAFLQGTGKMRGFNVARTSVHVATLAAMLCCVAVGFTTVWAFAIATLVGNSVPWIVARLSISTPWANAIVALPVARDLVRYGWRVQLGAWSAMANLRLDQLVLALVVPFSSLGLYVVAFTYSSVLTIIPSALSLIMLPAVAAAKNTETSNQEFVTLARWATWGSVGVGVVLAVAAQPALMLLFGSDYQAALAFVPILVPASVILGLNQVLAAGLRALGVPEVASKGELVGLVVTLVGLAAFVPLAGAYGAAWTSLLAYSATCGYLLTRSRRVACLRITELWTPSRQELASLKSLLDAVTVR